MSFWPNVKTSNNRSVAVKLHLINEISDEGPEALLTSDEADKIDFLIDKTLVTSDKWQASREDAKGIVKKKIIVQQKIS